MVDRENNDYAINFVGGKVVPPDALELIVSDHCNISCRQCNHASPVMSKWNLSPDQAYSDLRLLSNYYAPKRLKLIGGEPLLNPHIAEIAKAARASGIAPHIYVVTNGLLLNRMSDELWKELDAVEISLYETRKPPEQVLSEARNKAARHRTNLLECRYDSFRYTFTSREITDEGLAQDVFDGCRIAQVWHCHALYKGRLYRCPQSIYATSVAGSDFEDGIELEDSETFRNKLIDLVTRKEALRSCRHCVGTAGKKQPHALIDRRHWFQDIDKPIEEILDRELLESTLAVRTNRDDCRVELERPKTFRQYMQKKLRKLRQIGTSA